MIMTQKAFLFSPPSSQPGWYLSEALANSHKSCGADLEGKRKKKKASYTNAAAQFEPFHSETLQLLKDTLGKIRNKK